MLLVELRSRVLQAALEMSRQGLSRGTSGNVSARDPDSGFVVITPSNIAYEQLEPRDIVVVDDFGNLIEGKHRPSSETPMHTAVYRARQDVLGICHTHSVYATAFSVTNRGLPCVTVPLALLGPVPLVPFEIPGSEDLASACVQTLGDKFQAVLLQNHGVLSTGKSVEQALSTAVYVEEGAQVALLSLVAGAMNPIPEVKVHLLREQYYAKKPHDA